MRLKDLLARTSACQRVELRKYDGALDVTFCFVGTCQKILDGMKQDGLKRLETADVMSINCSDEGVLVIRLEMEEV